VLAWLRSIHELVWAWLFVAAIGLSPFAAIFALALPYAGILGRIYADLLNDVSPGPLRALRAAGAGETKVLFYGRLPMALPDMVAYSFYRFECALRSAAIMGFIGLGGLGFQVQIALADLKYSTVSTYVLAMILLIVIVETWSSIVRREMTS
jgi:phosphonate transport system permease protein